MPYYNNEEDEEKQNYSNNSLAYFDQTVNINNSFHMQNHFINLDSIDSF